MASPNDFSQNYTNYYDDGYLYMGRTVYEINEDTLDQLGPYVATPMPVRAGPGVRIAVGVPIPTARTRGYHLRYNHQQLVVEESAYIDGTRRFDIVVGLPGPAPVLMPHIDTRGVAIGVPIRKEHIRVYSHNDEYFDQIDPVD